MGTISSLLSHGFCYSEIYSLSFLKNSSCLYYCSAEVYLLIPTGYASLLSFHVTVHLHGLTNTNLVYCAEITNGNIKENGSEDWGVLTISIYLISCFAVTPALFTPQTLDGKVWLKTLCTLSSISMELCKKPSQAAVENWQAVTLLQAIIKSAWCRSVNNWYSSGSLWRD